MMLKIVTAERLHQKGGWINVKPVLRIAFNYKKFAQSSRLSKRKVGWQDNKYIKSINNMLVSYWHLAKLMYQEDNWCLYIK
jgi:hypothetical protein